MNATTCILCGKSLTDPVSRARGIGPDCASREARYWERSKPDFFSRCNFDHGSVDGVICVIDNDKTGTQSVTNGVTDVLAILEREYGSLAGRLIIYRDTAGVWDQIVTAKSSMGTTECREFRRLGENDMGRALRAVIGA